MNECTKISVVMPVYNVEKYLQEAVESILHQTYSNWELILVDDGSTDSSGVLCEEWVKKDERIQVVHTANGGLSHARNTGLARATGEWVIFPDSDDRLDERALEIMLGHTDDVDVVICMLEEFPLKRTFQAVDAPIRYDRFTDTAADFCHLHGMHIFSSACTKLYRRKCMTMLFDESIRHMEDILFNLEYLPMCKGIKVIPDVLYQYRREAVMTLSKKFWMDTLQIRKRELNSILEQFSGNKTILKMVSHRYVFYIMRWICEVVQLKDVDRSHKKILLELNLPDALDVRGIEQLEVNGIDALAWWCVKNGKTDVILTMFQWYSKRLPKSRWARV